jgi:hypothetical protein
MAPRPNESVGFIITGRKHANKLRASATERRICAPAYNGQERAMLNNLSEQIRQCLQHAEDCARKAAAQPDGSQLRQDFLRLEKRWRALARSYEFTERLGHFSDETKRQADKLPKP